MLVSGAFNMVGGLLMRKDRLVGYFESLSLRVCYHSSWTWEAMTEIFGTSDIFSQKRRIVGLRKSIPTNQESEFSKITDRSCNFPNYGIHLENCVKGQTRLFGP